MTFPLAQPRVSLPNVSERVRIAEHTSGLLELGEVLSADEGGDIAAVACDDDPLLPALDSVNHLGPE